MTLGVFSFYVRLNIKRDQPLLKRRHLLFLFHHDVERDADVSLSLISTEEKERYKLWEPTSAVGMSLYRFKTSTPGVKDRITTPGFSFLTGKWTYGFIFYSSVQKGTLYTYSLCFHHYGWLYNFTLMVSLNYWWKETMLIKGKDTVFPHWSATGMKKLTLGYKDAFYRFVENLGPFLWEFIPYGPIFNTNTKCIPLDL